MEQKIKVMHVDDDDDIRLITKMSFSLNPSFVLEQCNSGANALELVKTFQPDLFLLDMVMPGMSGEETRNEFRKDGVLSKIPTIFMSARAEESFATDLIEKGAAAVIIKPFDPMHLCNEILEILEKTGNSAQDETQTNELAS